MKILQGFALPLVLLCLLFPLSGCGRVPIASVWRDRPIVVDGQDTEWDDARVILDQASVGLGLMNDGEYLYLALSLTDPALQAQILRQGFIVWFDPRGGKTRTLGIRFPLGMREMAGGEEEGERSGLPPGRGRGGMPEGGMGRGGVPTAEQLQRMYERLGEAPELEILGPTQGQQRRLLLAESDEILLRTSYVRGRLVYELRLPLASTPEKPYGLGSTAGKAIGLGFETPQLDLAALRQRRGGMRGGEMDEGMGEMRGGGMGGMRGGGMGGARGEGMDGMRGGTMPEPFQLWTRVGLAAGVDGPAD